MRFLMALLILIYTNSLNAKIFNVGTGISCEYSQLQTAINQAMLHMDVENELRLVDDGSFNHQSFIINQSQFKKTSIVGGFANCDDAINNIVNGKTRIDAQDTEVTSPIFTMISSVAGINSLDDFSIKFSNLILQGSRSIMGGAIYIENASAIITNSQILNNQAQYGGGIYCKSELTLSGLLIGDVEIINNHALFDGGGLYIAGNVSDNHGLGCYTVLSHNGSSVISENISDNNGGAIYVDNYLEDILFGSSVFDSNQAKNGGALYFQSGKASISGTFTNNTAIQKGGLIFLGDSSNASDFLDIIGEIRNNSAGISGGAFYSQSVSLSVWNSIIENNQAPIGAIANVHGNFRLEQSVVKNHNNSANLFFGSSTENFIFTDMTFTHNIIANNTNIDHLIEMPIGKLRVLTSYIVDNQVNQSVIKKDRNPVNGTDLYDYLTIAGNEIDDVVFDLNNTHHEIRNNIIWQPGINLFNISNTEGIYNCNIVSSQSEFLNGTHNEIIDPQFISVNNANYHVRTFSPAVDYCEQGSFGFATYDIEGDNGMFSIEFIDDRFGPVDIGADQKDTGDYNFANGFE